MGLVCFVLGLSGVLGGAGWATVSAIREGRAGRERWGRVTLEQARVGDGAFRSSRLARYRLRGVPWLVWLAGVPGSLWGILGPCVATPTLGVLALALAAESIEGATLGPLLALLAAAATLIVGYFVYAASAALLRCERGAGARARLTGTTVALVDGSLMAVLAAVTGADQGIERVSLGLLGVGALHGLVLFAAGARVEVIQRALSDAEWAELPLDG